MGRAPCCDRTKGLKKGPWTPEEDKLLVDYIQTNGHGSWRLLPKLAGQNSIPLLFHSISSRSPPYVVFFLSSAAVPASSPDYWRRAARAVARNANQILRRCQWCLFWDRNRMQG